MKKTTKPAPKKTVAEVMKAKKASPTVPHLIIDVGHLSILLFVQVAELNLITQLRVQVPLL